MFSFRQNIAFCLKFITRLKDVASEI